MIYTYYHVVLRYITYNVVSAGFKSLFLSIITITQNPKEGMCIPNKQNSHNLNATDMQFAFISKLGNTRMLFNASDLNDQVNAAFKTKFETIGGQRSFIIQGIGRWKFPDHITSQVIQEIIHNTCFVCGGLMINSTALQNQLVSFDDFGNDSGLRGTTQSRVEHPKQIQVRKCSQCGHSHT